MATENHAGNQSSRSHPLTTEGKGGIYSHRILPNGYRHHWHPKITTTCLNEDEVRRTGNNTQRIGGYSPNWTLRAYILERGLLNPASYCTLRQHNWQGRDKKWSSQSQGKTWSQAKWPCAIRNGRYVLQELHRVSYQQDVVQGDQRPIYVLYKRPGPQTPRPSHRVLFSTTHRRCGGYFPSD